MRDFNSGILIFSYSILIGGLNLLIFFPIKMVTLKEYEAYLKVKRFIDGHDESEIILRLMGDSKYIPLIIKSDDADPIKYYSTSAAARHCGVTKQTLDYAHRNRCMRIVRRKGGVKEFRITWL